MFRGVQHQTDFWERMKKMSYMDFRDKLDAEEALQLAKSHGNSNSIMAFRDRLDANILIRQYNQTQENLRGYREKVEGKPVKVDKLEEISLTSE